MDDSLHARGKALEDQFFREKDNQLLEKLRAELSGKESRDALSTATGISDTAVLDALLENKVTAESLTSVSLIPLVAVAWADGSMDANERTAILDAAAAVGVPADSASFQLVSGWLNEKPSAELLKSWKEYIAALKTKLDPAALNELKTTVMQRAKLVADAAGGILGIGKTSASEAKVLRELEETFG